MKRITTVKTAFEGKTPLAKCELFKTATKILEAFKLQVTLIFGIEPCLGRV